MEFYLWAYRNGKAITEMHSIKRTHEDYYITLHLEPQCYYCEMWVGGCCVRVCGQMTISEEMLGIFIIELTNLRSTKTMNASDWILLYVFVYLYLYL